MVAVGAMSKVATVTLELPLPDEAEEDVAHGLALAVQMAGFALELGEAERRTVPFVRSVKVALEDDAR